MEIERKIERTTDQKRKLVQTLQLYDANIWLGKPSFFPLAQELNPSDVGRLFQEYGLKGALISHWDSSKLSAQDGNLALIEAAGALPEGAFTIWTGLPTVPREKEPLVGPGRSDLKMRAVRLFPKTHHYELTPWVVGELCEWCVERRIPVFFWHVELDWRCLHALASTYPELRIVIETQWQKILYQNRNLFCLLKSCPNVLVESSNLMGQDNVSYLVRSFGAERVLFGSFLPVNDPWAAIGMIVDADISDSEKRLIAGENLSRMIAEVHI